MVRSRTRSEETDANGPTKLQEKIDTRQWHLQVRRPNRRKWVVIEFQLHVAKQHRGSKPKSYQRTSQSPLKMA